MQSLRQTIDTLSQTSAVAPLASPELTTIAERSYCDASEEDFPSMSGTGYFDTIHYISGATDHFSQARTPSVGCLSSPYYAAYPHPTPPTYFPYQQHLHTPEPTSDGHSQLGWCQPDSQGFAVPVLPTPPVLTPPWTDVPTFTNQRIPHPPPLQPFKPQPYRYLPIHSAPAFEAKPLLTPRPGAFSSPSSLPLTPSEYWFPTLPCAYDEQAYTSDKSKPADPPIFETVLLPSTNIPPVAAPDEAASNSTCSAADQSDELHELDTSRASSSLPIPPTDEAELELESALSSSEDSSSSPEPVFQCPTCSRTFARRQNLISHAKVHAASRPYNCVKCTRAFSRKHDLQRHIRSLHRLDRPWACERCGKTFARRDGQRRHADRNDGRGACFNKRQRSA